MAASRLKAAMRESFCAYPEADDFFAYQCADAEPLCSQAYVFAAVCAANT